VKVALLPNNATFIIFVNFFEIMFFGKAQSQKKKNALFPTAQSIGLH